MRLRLTNVICELEAAELQVSQSLCSFDNLSFLHPPSPNVFNVRTSPTCASAALLPLQIYIARQKNQTHASWRCNAKTHGQTQFSSIQATDANDAISTSELCQVLQNNVFSLGLHFLQGEELFSANPNTNCVSKCVGWHS